MGKNNRERRAAKKRARQRRGSTSARGSTSPGHGVGEHGPDCTCGIDREGLDDAGGFWPPTPPADALAEALLAAAQAHAADDPTMAADFAAELADRYAARGQRVLGTAAGMALARVVEHMWGAGWLPADLWEVVRRGTGAAGTSLLVDTVAADTARHAAGTVHQRWAAQVRQLDADVWWDQGQPHLPQWAKRRGLDIEEALRATITVLAELMTLPELPRILPPPGTAVARAATTATGVDQKVLGRVRGLLAKAEATTFPEEAEALSAKAQELMNRHAFERALLDADEHRPQAATSTRVWLDRPYVEAKSHLVAAIAEANRCRSVFYANLGFVALVGEHLDLEITELLATSLLVQATRAMVAEGRQINYAGTSRTRSFRQSFLVSYATRIGERLTEASNHAHDPADDARLLPVLADRSRMVEDTFQQMFSRTVQKSVSVTNGAGWHAGRAAADRADLILDRRGVDE